MTRSLDWMPVDGDCVVSGQISGSAKAGLVSGFSLSSLLFDFCISNSKRNLENRKDEPPLKPSAPLAFQ